MHYDGSHILRVGGPHSLQEVQQWGCQLWSAIVWPLGVVKLQHRAAVPCAQLGKRRKGEWGGIIHEVLSEKVSGRVTH